MTEATTSYLYTTRCQLEQVLHPDGSITEHTYDCNGNLERTWDANHPSAGQTTPPTTTYGYDELDRLRTLTRPWAGASGGVAVTQYPGVVPFSLSRLTAITRDGHTIAYGYDRFGRTIQDGALTYGYDENGNRTTIGYPGGVMATYGYDFFDRETTLTVTTPTGTTPVVTAAEYLPSGPLTELTFGTGAVESHTYDTRYLPAAIALDAAADRTWVLCGLMRDATHVALHEAAYFADCWKNNDTFKDEEEGCNAEVACFGFTIGTNCKSRGYPFKR